MVGKKKVVKKVVKKKVLKKNDSKKKVYGKNIRKKIVKHKSKPDKRKIPTLKLQTDHEIALDFATKSYQKFSNVVKSIILFGSTVKQSAVPGSDIDIIIVVDDISIKWDAQTIAWYRKELDLVLQSSPYTKNIHINTIKLSTWWNDLMVGDPVLVNVIRYGEALVDFAGFFEPLKYLLLTGQIKSTPEAIYSALNRAPQHLLRSKAAELGSIEGLYWSMVDSSHAALMTMHVTPPSPEHISANLKEHFVNTGKLKMKYVDWYRELHVLHKRISHGELRDLRGVQIDLWQDRAEEFLDVMTKIIKSIID